jgi:hypothetical protein
VRVLPAVLLSAGIAAVVGFLVGSRVGSGGPAPNETSAEVRDELRRVASALERLDARSARGDATLAPTPAARPGPADGVPSWDEVARRLDAIAARLERAGPKPPHTGTAPEEPRDRNAHHQEGLLALERTEAEALRRKHFMSTGQDVLDRYGLPDRVNYWTGQTIRWSYSLPSEGATVVFELTGGHVSAVLVERNR